MKMLNNSGPGTDPCGTPLFILVQSSLLLFLIYINDIYNSSEKLSFYIYADDRSLPYADKDLKSPARKCSEH